MVDFENPYYAPMDRAYHVNLPENDRRTDSIEEPIFPVSRIGQTIAWERKQGSIIQEVETAFKRGAGNIQLAMEVIGQTSGMGGGPKAYGKDVREAIREIQRASNAKITGVELPTSLTNLSGYDQRGQFNEEQRNTSLAEVRDAIKFIGDIAGGGTVDIVSFEYNRDFEDTKWAKDDAAKFRQMAEPTTAVVDVESGKLIPINKKDKFYYFYNKDGTKSKEPIPFEWKDVVQLAKLKNMRPEDFWVQEQFNTQKNRLLGDEGHYQTLLEDVQRAQHEIKEAIKNKEISEEQGKARLNTLELREKGFRESLNAIEIQKKDLDRAIHGKYVPIDSFGLEKSKDSYATAGIWAMQESQKNQFVTQGKGAVSVGPEIGWPQFYGSHPKEWVELITEARKRMVEKLTKPEYKDPFTGEIKRNEYYDPSITEKEAEKLAKQHIKGELDTSHLGMWFNNFKPELPPDERLKEFKKWYKDQIEYLAKENKEKDIIGGIQMVDSATGAHGHLPAGEGILGKDIFEYMKILTEKGGYKGEITSEGHEDYAVGPERILSKAWETMGSHIMLPYQTGAPNPTAASTRQSYAMTPYSTRGIYQNYVPSNDFTLWSQVPFE